VAAPAGDVAGLRVGRAAGLGLPEAVILLADQAELAVGLSVPRRVVPGVGRARRIGALAPRQRVEELGQLRLVLAADGRDAERRERAEVAVELADPVDQPVAA